jgi:hypothetical protein
MSQCALVDPIFFLGRNQSKHLAKNIMTKFPQSKNKIHLYGAGFFSFFSV